MSLLYSIYFSYRKVIEGTSAEQGCFAVNQISRDIRDGSEGKYL